jgi:ribosomal protein S27E
MMKTKSKQKNPNPFDQWRTDCPKCHNRDCLTVFAFTDATGKQRHPDARLCPDGFETGLPERFVKKHGGDTDKERVRCDSCGEIFTLDDLKLPEVS